jgi:Zn-dependent metalloprotease
LSFRADFARGILLQHSDLYNLAILLKVPSSLRLETMAWDGCAIVSPHLLEALTASNDPEARQLAKNTLKHSHHVRTRRVLHFERKWKSEGFSEAQSIMPVQVLEHAASEKNTDEASRTLAQHTLETKRRLETDHRTSTTTTKFTLSSKLHRQIYDMQNIARNDQAFPTLPGKLVRSEGESPVPDEHVNQAYDNCAIVLEFYEQVFNYTFLDAQDMPVISSVHFDQGYQNAQWYPPAKVMLYGDGGHNLYNFTACLDIIGHEMTVRSSSLFKLALQPNRMISMRSLSTFVI